MKYLFVFNTLSGRLKSKKLLANIEQHIKEDEYFRNHESHFLYITDKNASNQFISDATVLHQITHLILFGGDGTFQNMINYFYSTDKTLLSQLTFGFMPWGSGNGLARELKMPFDIKHGIKVIKSNRTKSINTLLVNNKYLVLHNIGLGFDAVIAGHFDKTKRRGLGNYILLVLQNILKRPHFKCTIQNKELNESVETFMLTLSNTAQLGMNFKIAPLAKLDDNLFDVTILPKQNLFVLLNNFMKFLSQPRITLPEIGTKKIIYFQTSELNISNYNNTAIQVGGELIKEKFEHLNCKIADVKIKCLSH